MSDEQTQAAPSSDSSNLRPSDSGSPSADDGRGEQSNNGGIYATQGGGGVRSAPEGGDKKREASGDDSLKKEMTNDLKEVVAECRKFAAFLQEKHGASVLILCETVFREAFHVGSGMNLQTTLGLLDLTSFHVKNQLNLKKDIT